MRLFAEEARAWQHAATPFVLLFVVGIPFAFAAILRYDPDPNPNLNPTPQGMPPAVVRSDSGTRRRRSSQSKPPPLDRSGSVEQWRSGVALVGVRSSTLTLALALALTLNLALPLPLTLARSLTLTLPFPLTTDPDPDH